MEIPTPTGWTTMGDLRAGDTVFDERGQPCQVTFATEIMFDRVCYDVVFDDGTVIVADAEHQWLTKTHAVRKAEARRITGESSRAGRPQCERRHFPQVVTTEQIRETLIHGDRERNHSVDVAGALQLPDADLPIDPYVFGVWLGDGDARDPIVTSGDDEMPTLLESAGCKLGPARPDPRSQAVRYRMGPPDGVFRSHLKALGVWRNKHIPVAYLRASASQRMALLHGLMDTDGSVTPRGHCEFCGTSKALTDGVFELAASLGMKPTLAEERARLNGRDCGPRYRVTFTAHMPVFRLSRKLARQHTGKGQAQRVKRRYIVDVVPRESVPVRCIQVDSPSHLFLASRAMVPTHNTRTGAEWVRGLAESGAPNRKGIALVGATVDDARDIIVEGESGIIAISPPWFMPVWTPSKRTLVWPNGEWARTYSADKPDRLRGKQHAYAWADELAAWRYEDAWDQLMLGLRLGPDPRVAVTTTPRPIPMIRSLVKSTTTCITTGSSYENRGNLAKAFFQQIVGKYEGTRLGRQELNAEILDDNPAALWNRQRLDALRVVLRRKDGAPEVDPVQIAERLQLKRIVVAIDPAVTSEAGSDETGIIVSGMGQDGHGYVLEDCSGKYTPSGWAEKAVDAYQRWQANTMVAEVNNGGDLVENTVRHVKGGRAVAYQAVRAARGKLTRAEPVASLDEQGKVHHVGFFPQLEDQLCDWDPTCAKSPDRLDARVWAITHLMIGAPPPPRGHIDSAMARFLG